jgi:hypothetical protein
MENLAPIAIFTYNRLDFLKILIDSLIVCENERCKSNKSTRILISSLTTKYRDLKQLISFGVQLWMYITPIIFPLTSVSGKYRIFFLANPLTGIVETFRTILLGVGEINYFFIPMDELTRQLIL